MMQQQGSRVILLIGVLGLLVSLSSGIANPGKQERKQLQGPPSEFADFATPTPEQAAQRVSSALLAVQLQQLQWTATFAVDNKEELSLALLSPHEAQLKVYVQPPTATDYTLLKDELFTGDGALGVKSSGPFGIDGAHTPSTTYTFFEPALGEWKIKIESDSVLPKIKSSSAAASSLENSLAFQRVRDYADEQSRPDAYLLIENESSTKLYSHLTSYVLDEGQQVGVAIKVYDEQEQPTDLVAVPKSKVGVVIDHAVLDVFTPSGKEVKVVMHDDGLHNDGLANDGTYAATVFASDAGDYVARAIVGGKKADGTRFVRTSQHLIGVSSCELRLTRQAFATYDAKNKVVNFLVDVTDATPHSQLTSTVRAYSEVWGQSLDDPKTPVAIAWASAMVDSEDVDGHQSVVELQVHENWIQLAKASPPFVLKNVILQDRDSFAILSQAPEIAVTEGGKSMELYNTTRKNAASEGIEITDEMRYGRRPDSLSAARSINSSGGVSSPGKVLLVHGYCSQSVWPAKDFTDAIVFQDYGNSRSNDQFARLIMEAGADSSSYSIVAHSQGGLASLHLKTYYWSGLDNAQKGRLIQSVGSPYRGCSMAGVLADIGWLFGLGCGSNFDLSVDGASLWYSKLPKYVGGPQDAVYYYTTRYTNNWWFFSNCVTAANLILSKPNDGTCELKYASLDNGHGMGTVDGWCHIGDMKYPPQCSDGDRNAQMNHYAAR